MRPFLLVGLAACWSNPPPKTPPRAPIATAEVAAPAPPPAPPPPRAYRLPAQIADALATEPLVGQVIVDDEARLMATEAAARTATGSRKNGATMAARVVADHGDVVEIETARVADCVASFGEPYQLTVFVRRDQLVPRTKTEVTKTYADGTAVAIDRGAPVSISARGLAWEGSLRDVPLPPAEDQLTYAVPAITTAAALPAQPGDRMVCDHGGAPQTLTEWRDERRAKREAERRAKVEEQRAQIAAREAELERARAEELKKCKAKAAAKKKKAKTKQDGIGRLIESDACGMALLFGSVTPIGYGEGFGDGLGASYDEERYAPYCSITRPWYEPSTTAKPPAPPTLDGKPMPWPDNPSRSVVRVGKKYLGDIDYGCGRARIAVEDVSAVGGGGTGIGTIGGLGGQAQVQVWVPKPGLVTWPDGSPAGRYTGRKRYRTVVEQDSRICVKVAGVDELVCHDKSTAKTEMVAPYLLRD